MTDPTVIQVTADNGPGIIEVRTGAFGPPGPQGAAGADGADGADGQDGADGAGTTILNLSDTPDAYTSLGGAFLRVNSAANATEFSYSTPEYCDVRDYGTVAQNGDITAAWLAAAAAAKTIGHARVRVQKFTGASSFVLDASQVNTYLAANTGTPWQFEFDCFAITLTNPPITIAGRSIWRGVSSGTTNSFLARPEARPRITGDGTSTKVCSVRATNVLIEGLIFNGGGKALDVQGVNLVTIRNCQFSSSQDIPLRIESSFWVKIENITCTWAGTQTSTSYALAFTTDENWGTNTGIVKCKDIKVVSAGVLFRSQYGTAGVGNIDIDEIHSESQGASQALFHFDSSAALSVAGIRAQHIGISDTVGTVYQTRYTGSNNFDITISGGFRSGTGSAHFYDPASTSLPRRLFYDGSWDMNATGLLGNDINQGILLQWDGTSRPDQIPTFESVSAIDKRLISAPVGVPWVIGTPLACIQNPASWTAGGGATITSSGILGPHGSTTNVGNVTGGNARVLSASVTPSLGDYYLCGVWARSSNTEPVCDLQCTLETTTAGFELNNSLDPILAQSPEYNMDDDGWHWISMLAKVTALPGGAVTLRFFVNVSGAGDYYNPTVLYIPASSTPDPVWLLRYARSWRGGCSVNGVAGTVGYDLPVSVDGQFATPSATATIATGAITATAGYMVVDTEAAAATDDLDTITGSPVMNGSRLVLRAANTARTVVVKDGTGNIQCAGDFSLDNTQDTIELIYDSTLSAWLELNRSDNGA